MLNIKLNKFGIIIALMSAFILVSCDDDDDDSSDIPTGTVTATEQYVTNAQIVVSEIEMSDPGWVVIHRDNGSGGPIVPDIISEPMYVAAGTSNDVVISLKDGETLEEDETLWVMLHIDTGVLNSYEFDTDQTLDVPISDSEGNPEMTSIMVKSPILEVNNQPLGDNDQIIASMTRHNLSGWLVVHRDNGSGGPVVPAIISNPVLLTAGENSDVEITFKDGEEVSSGETLWVMLHADTGTAGDYEFDTDQTLDTPILDLDGDIMMEDIIIQ